MNLIKKTLCTLTNQLNITPKISIIGSGPAGFYTAQYLLKKLKKCEIDIYEKLPLPFGLVRFGVAPDHPEVKNVINTFNKVAEHENVRFLGNIDVGNNVSVEELLNAYHIVVLAYGADKNKNLNISGENLNNVLPARRIVGWYNGIPSDKDIPIDLNGENVVIFGQGNVAIDIARILLKPIDELKNTDITEHALDKLSKSKIKNVHLIGRRGPLQAAFTIAELREMLKLETCKTEWNVKDFENLEEILPKLTRPRKRITELMLNSLNTDKINNLNTLKPIFFRTPLEFIGETSIRLVKLGINTLKGDDFSKQKAVLTDSEEYLDCNLGVVSIGYKSKSIDSYLNFDENLGILKNNFGRIDKGLYTTGWVATGPIGVILTTMNNSFNVANLILKDIEKDSIKESKSGYDHVKEILNKKNIQIVTWKDWKKIDSYEIENGKNLGKPREKIVDIKEMLRIAAI